MSRSSDRIRVLHFPHTFTNHDFVDTVVRFCDRSRFEMMACVLKESADFPLPDYSAEGIPLWKLPNASRSSYPLVAYKLALLLRRQRVAILHTHHYDQSVIGWMATRLHRKTKLVVGRHYSDSIYRSSCGLKRWLWLHVESRVNRAAGRIIAPSNYIQQILTEWQGVASEKVTVIPYGFVASKYQLPELLPVLKLRRELAATGELLIGTFGRLHEEKGHRYLLAAMNQLHREGYRSLRLVIVGDGPERPAIERQIEALGLRDSITVLGFRKDALEMMSAVDIVVQPTLQEAFSQVMIEALWMKKPLVITKVSGASDVIQHGHNGLLVDTQDAAGLARAIRSLLNSPAMRHELGQRGYRFVNSTFTIERIVKRYEECYLDLMALHRECASPATEANHERASMPADVA